MGADPVRQCLCPARLSVGQVRRAQHADEDLCHHDLAGERIDDWHLLAGVINERLVPGGMGLAHRRRQTALEGAVKVTEPRVAVALRMNRLIFLPQNHQADAGPLHLPHQRGPIGLRMASHSWFGSHLLGEQ